MFDSVLFERAGVPSVPIITEPFVPTAEAILKMHGVPDMPFVAVPHPITSLSDDDLRERARQAAPQVEAILLGRPRP